MNAREAIVAAVKARDTNKVEALLDQDPGLARTETTEGSLLLTAVYYGADAAARKIRALRDDLTIFEAAALGDVARVRDLLAREPGLARTFDPGGGTALHLAAFFGHVGVVEALLDAGADVNVMSRVNLPNIPRNTPLHAALAGRRREVARLLIQRGADVTAVDSAGLTPLHHAAAGGNVEIVSMLLDRGARVDARDEQGQTPLDYALRGGHEEVVALLRGRGA